jgi:hypothetical protein
MTIRIPALADALGKRIEGLACGKFLADGVFDIDWRRDALTGAGKNA